MVENWVDNAQAAVRAAIDADAFELTNSIARLIEDPEEPMALIRATFLWCDMLLAATPMAGVMMHMPPREELTEHQRFAIDLLDARAADDADAAQLLLINASDRGWDWFTEAFIGLLTLIAGFLRACEAYYRQHH